MEHRFKVNSNGNVSREEWDHTVDHFLERFSPRVLSGIFQFLDADGKEDHQGRFQVQLDTSLWFDSPAVIDSGVVTSAKSGWKAPAGRVLKPGKYYVRMRVSDDKEPEIFGAWSYRGICFEVKDAQGRTNGLRGR